MIPQFCSCSTASSSSFSSPLSSVSPLFSSSSSSFSSSAPTSFTSSFLPYVLREFTAKYREIHREKLMKGGIVILKLVQKMLMRKIPSSSYDHDHDFEEHDNSLPEDVKEGHFAVHTVDDGEVRRFVIELSYLAHPGFQKLLKQAEEEFGFRQMGILAIPCTYNHLLSVIGSK